MHIKVSQKHLDFIEKQTWLKEKYLEMCKFTNDKSKLYKWLNENPDFVQTMTNLALSDEIEIVYDEEDMIEKK